MSDQIIGRVTIKVIPEVVNKRPEMDRDMDRNLDKMEERASKRKPVKIEVELDTDGLDRDLDKAVDDLGDETRKKQIHLKVGFDYDDVLRGSERIRNALKDLERKTISVDMNKQELDKALDKMQERLDDEWVTLRVSDDIDGAREVLKKIDAIRKEKLGIDVTFESSDEDLDRMEAELKDKFRDRIVDLTGVGLRLNTEMDHDSLLAAKAEVEKALKDLQSKQFELQVGLDKESLEQAARDIDAKLAKAPAHMRVSNDLDGAKSVLAKIKAMRKELEEPLDFKLYPNEKSFKQQERKIKRMFQDQIVDLTGEGFKVTSELDRASLRAALAQVEKAKQDLANKPIEIQTTMDSAGLERAGDQLRTKLNSTPLKLRYDPNSRESILGAIAELRKEVGDKPLKAGIEIESPTPAKIKAQIKALEKLVKGNFDNRINLKVNFEDQESLKRAKAQIESQLSDLKTEDISVKLNEKKLLEAKHRIESFINEESGKDVEVVVNPTGIGLAAARLSYLTRPRTASIIVAVDRKSLAIAQGILKSLSGLNVLQKVGTTLENVVKNFDKFAIKSVGWLTAIGGLVNVLGYMGTSLFTIGGGVSQVIGLAALVPTLAGATASVFTIMTMGFNNFMQSFSDIPIVAEQALKKLPPEARKARDAMAGLWTEIRDPVQDQFWKSLGTSVQDFANRVAPALGRGLLSVTPAVAKFTSNILDSFKEIAENGQMESMFDNLGIGLANMAKGAKPFFDAVNTLGLRGSEFLPRMGTALADMAEDFDTWIERADQAGDINRWIEEGIQSMKDMGGVVVAVSRQFKALTQIIDAAGGQGLDGFRKNMEGWADAMEGEPFRSRMVKILGGARDGAHEINTGFKDLTGTIGESADAVQALLILLGRVGGSALSRIADILGSNQLKAGLLVGVEKVARALSLLKPAAKDVGSILGTMFDVSGSVILGITPLLTNVTNILRVITTDLGPTLRDLVPILSGFLNNLLTLTTGPLQLLADGLQIAVGALKNMPGPLQNLTLAFLGFLALRGRIGGMLGTLNNFWTSQKTTMSGGVATVTTNAQKFQTALGKIPTVITTAGGKIGTATSGLATKMQGVANAVMFSKAAKGINIGPLARGLQAVPTAINTASDRVKTATGRLSTAGAGVATAVGGIGTALGRILSMGGGLGGVLLFTGIIAGITALGDAARKQREKVDEFKASLDDLGNTTFDSDKLNANFLSSNSTAFRGEMKSFAKVLDDLGFSSQNAVKALSGTQEEYNSFVDAIASRQDELARLQTDRINFLNSTTGYSPDMHDDIIEGYKDEAGALNDVENKLRGYKRVQDIAQQEARDTAKALGISTSSTLELKDAFSTLEGDTAGVAERISKVSTALDILTGGLQSKQDVAIAFADSLRGIKDSLKEAFNTGGIGLKDIINKDGKINVDIDADPTGLKAKVAQSLTTGVSAAMTKALDSVKLLPKEQQAAAFAQAYQKNLDSLKAEVVPTVKGGGFDPDASKAFDAWIKANGFDSTTVSTVIDGEVNEAEVANLAEGVRRGLEAFFNLNPTEVPIDGDAEDLNHVVNDAHERLTRLSLGLPPVPIDADGRPLTKEAIAAREQLERLRLGLPPIPIDADAAGLTEEAARAQAEIDAFNKQPVVVKFNADRKALVDKIAASEAQLRELASKKPTPKLDADKEALRSKIAEMLKQLADLDKKRPKPKADLDKGALDSKQKNAKDKVNELDRMHATASAALTVLGLGAGQTMASLLRNFPGSVKRTISVHTKFTQSGASAVTRGGSGGLTGFDGGILGRGSQYRFKPSARWTSYANGGISAKPTSAHIARAGSYVTYAESSTGGEAFIPLSAAKRARSSAILAEVARMFGLQVVRRGKSYADGGINGSAAPVAAGATFYVTNHYPVAEPQSSAINRAAQLATITDR